MAWERHFFDESGLFAKRGVQGIALWLPLRAVNHRRKAPIKRDNAEGEKRQEENQLNYPRPADEGF